LFEIGGDLFSLVVPNLMDPCLLTGVVCNRLPIFPTGLCVRLRDAWDAAQRPPPDAPPPKSFCELCHPEGHLWVHGKPFVLKIIGKTFTY